MNIGDLPRTITRACCPRKQDFETDLYLRIGTRIADNGEVILWYEYLRESNGEDYFCASTVEEMKELLDDPSYLYVGRTEVTP